MCSITIQDYIQILPHGLISYAPAGTLRIQDATSSVRLSLILIPVKIETMYLKPARICKPNST